ncbi:hypothetical protein EON67_07655 [archaeon]|nr:MAG: hypothetical protein EON67_07655 [archaeon]
MISAQDLNDIEPADLLKASAETDGVPQPTVFIVSCFGRGEPTDSAKAFVAWLNEPARESERDAFSKLRYTVFGLGSSKVCVAARARACARVCMFARVSPPRHCVPCERALCACRRTRSITTWWARSWMRACKRWARCAWRRTARATTPTGTRGRALRRARLSAARVCTHTHPAMHLVTHRVQH